MNTLVILSLVFISFFSLFLLILWLAKRHFDPTIKRIRDLEHLNKRTQPAPDQPSVVAKNNLPPKVDKVLTTLNSIANKDEKKVSKIRHALVQAGYHHENSLKLLMGAKVISALVLFLLFLYIGSMSDKSGGTVFLLSLVTAFVGYQIPNYFLTVQIRKRQGEIAAGLPDALDLMVISVEAGLGLNAAMHRVSEDLSLRCRPLAEELQRVNHDMRTGLPREEALRHLSLRNKVEDLRILVGALVLADRLGTSIADTLRAQADSLRTRIRQKAEEQAAKAGIKMLLPLVLFILPALIIILMGPGLISIYRTFQH